MNIKNIKVNSYGNLNNKEIELKKGLNIIHGNNESGKSTLLNFIISSLYGISKNKEGKDISDYDRYNPWNNGDFSGRIKYNLDNQNNYEIFRDFNKKNPIIYNDKMEDISSDYSTIKKDGNQFFVEQTNVDKQMYLSTVVTIQQEVRLNQKDQNILVQKIANIASTGDDNVSYKKANEKLQNKIRDEIGTNKTLQKPINFVSNNINNLKSKIENISQYEDKKYNISQEKDRYIRLISELKIKNEICKLIKSENDEKRILETKVNVNESKINTNNGILKKLYNQKNELNIEKENIRNNKTSKEIHTSKELSKPIFTIVLILLIALIPVIYLIMKNYIIASIPAALIILLIIYKIIKDSKIKKLTKEKNDAIKNKIEEKNNEISNIEGQILILENENKEIIDENNKQKNEINNRIETNINSIKENFKNKIDNYEFNKIASNTNLNELNNEIEEDLKQYKTYLNKLEIEENTIIPKLDELVSLKEKEIANEEKYKNLKEKEEILNIAISSLKESYEEMKSTITPKFTKNISDCISKIFNEKYSKATINDENGIVVENKNGNYVDISKLSVGTIDQLYLSLRLSMIDELSTEKLPIILDESFAYFDNNRLKNILLFLENELNEHQVIILSCTDREKDILNKENIEYNYINL